MLRSEKWVSHFLDSAQWPEARIVMMNSIQHAVFQPVLRFSAEFLMHRKGLAGSISCLPQVNHSAIPKAVGVLTRPCFPAHEIEKNGARPRIISTLGICMSWRSGVEYWRQAWTEPGVVRRKRARVLLESEPKF
jgi:hypothetical protein